MKEPDYTTKLNYCKRTGKDKRQKEINKKNKELILRYNQQDGSGKLRPKECSKCKEVNPNSNKLCSVCGNPLDMDTPAQVDKVKETVSTILCSLISEGKLVNEENTKAKVKEMIKENTLKL